MSKRTITVKGKKRYLDVIIITPEMAAKLLEANTLNRSLRQPLIDRIARQIKAGKWRFNGDTLKISSDGKILDGQHRLWAIVLADISVETVIVYDIAEDAFSTIDTIRALRNGADVLGLAGLDRHRRSTSTALTWLIRWQRGVVDTHKSRKNLVENSDIEECFQNHADMALAVDRCSRTKGLISPGISGFLYYIFSNQDQELADRFLKTLLDPVDVAVNDPFFRFRAWLITSLDAKRRREGSEMIALAFKAWNYARDGKTISVLSWRNSGPAAEAFPNINKIALRDLDIKKVKKAKAHHEAALDSPRA